MNFPFEDPIMIRQLDKDGLEGLLREFEDTWAEKTGDRLTSPHFYDVYRRGDVDSMFAMAWATYYEEFRRMERDPVNQEVVSSLSAGLVATG